MTEEEAKTKWCPFARTVWNDGSTETASWNRWVSDTPDKGADKPVSLCIGSACMAWRELPWSDTRAKILVRKGTSERINFGTSENSEWVLTNPDEPAPPKVGFCGLAGNP